MKDLHGRRVTHAEAREIAQRFVDGHFGNRKDGQLVRPHIEIPANPERDDDLRLSQYIDQCEQAESESRAGQVEGQQKLVAACVDLTETERDVLEHSTGWRSRSPLFRNHFVAGPGHSDWATLETLVSRGLMRIARGPSELSGGDHVFTVTDEGIALLKSLTPERPRKKRK